MHLKKALDNVANINMSDVNGMLDVFIDNLGDKYDKCTYDNRTKIIYDENNNKIIKVKLGYEELD